MPPTDEPPASGGGGSGVGWKVATGVCALLAAGALAWGFMQKSNADTAAQDSAATLRNRIARYCRPALLVIDEVGYLSYAHRHADLLFEIVTRRYEERSTIVTTNKPFSEWNEVFPNASCVVTLVDRLIHRAEIVAIEGGSYRFKEAKERAARKKDAKASAMKPSKPTHR